MQVLLSMSSTTVLDKLSFLLPEQLKLSPSWSITISLALCQSDISKIRYEHFISQCQYFQYTTLEYSCSALEWSSQPYMVWSLNSKKKKIENTLAKTNVLKYI